MVRRERQILCEQQVEPSSEDAHGRQRPGLPYEGKTFNSWPEPLESPSTESPADWSQLSNLR